MGTCWTPSLLSIERISGFGHFKGSNSYFGCTHDDDSSARKDLDNWFLQNLSLFLFTLCAPMDSIALILISGLTIDLTTTNRFQKLIMNCMRFRKQFYLRERVSIAISVFVLFFFAFYFGLCNINKQQQPYTVNGTKIKKLNDFNLTHTNAYPVNWFFRGENFQPSFNNTSTHTHTHTQPYRLLAALRVFFCFVVLSSCCVFDQTTDKMFSFVIINISYSGNKKWATTNRRTSHRWKGRENFLQPTAQTPGLMKCNEIIETNSTAKRMYKHIHTHTDTHR